MAELRNLQFTQEEIDKGKGMSVLAYLWILVFIPLLTSRDNKYVMFHTEQGLTLFITGIIFWFLFIFVDRIFLNMVSFTMCGGSILYLIVRLFLLILLILGIVNALQGNAKKLPIIGDFGEKFNLVK